MVCANTSKGLFSKSKHTTVCRENLGLLQYFCRKKLGTRTVKKQNKAEFSSHSLYWTEIDLRNCSLISPECVWTVICSCTAVQISPFLFEGKVPRSRFHGTDKQNTTTCKHQQVKQKVNRGQQEQRSTPGSFLKTFELPIHNAFKNKIFVINSWVLMPYGSKVGTFITQKNSFLLQINQPLLQNGPF